MKADDDQTRQLYKSVEYKGSITNIYITDKPSREDINFHEKLADIVFRNILLSKEKQV